MPDSFYQSLQKSELSLIAIWVVIKSSQINVFRRSWVFSRYSGFLPRGMLTGWIEISS